MTRYKVEFDQTGTSVVIYDRTMNAVCGLPTGRSEEPQPLRWEFEGDMHSDAAGDALSAAEDWLEHCYRTWQIVPRVNEPHPADVGWERVWALRAGLLADRHFRPNGPSTVSSAASKSRP